VAVDDQTRHLITLVGNDRLVQEALERNIGERKPGCDHLLGAIGGDPGQPVAGARWRRLGQEIAQVVENVTGGSNDVAINHGTPRLHRHLRTRRFVNDTRHRRRQQTRFANAWRTNRPLTCSGSKTTTRSHSKVYNRL
jgi:hypothetical protein